ncbi:hypothetical protein NMG60_11015736 [Bertholletia excelsa]
MAAGGGGESTSPTLQETPSWALATVCFVFIFLGIFVEHLIHLLAHWLNKHRKKALVEAVEKLKSVLMLLGFLSLLLAVTQKPISKICVSHKIAYSMLPCRGKDQTRTTKAHKHTVQHWEPFQDGVPRNERLLAADYSDYCGSKGLTSLISPDGINQLSIFIFVLAVMQIVYTVATMALGRAKMRHWKAWEKETQTVEYLVANDPDRFRLTRQTTFGKRHTSSCSETPVQLWIKCFFRQFFNPVAKVDYLTLRHGFIAAHLSTNNKFNFQKYIRRSLEDDFKLVVGINPFMWLWVVIFMLVDIVLVLGTKLEVIVAKMALDVKNHDSVIKGAPLVQPNDNHFWFHQPQFVLTLIHYVLFMNAFELSFFIWVTIIFGFHSCYHEHVEIIVVRVVLAVTVQFLCSYITLPLYALVTQMGSHYKSAVLKEETVQVMKQWHEGVRDKRKKQQRLLSESTRLYDSSTSARSSSNTTSPSISSHHRPHTLTLPATTIEIPEEIVPDEPTADIQTELADTKRESFSFTKSFSKREKNNGSVD